MFFMSRNKNQNKNIKSEKSNHFIGKWHKIDLYPHISVIFTTLIQVEYGLLVVKNCPLRKIWDKVVIIL